MSVTSFLLLLLHCIATVKRSLVSWPNGVCPPLKGGGLGFNLLHGIFGCLLFYKYGEVEFC